MREEGVRTGGKSGRPAKGQRTGSDGKRGEGEEEENYSSKRHGYIIPGEGR